MATVTADAEKFAKGLTEKFINNSTYNTYAAFPGRKYDKIFIMDKRTGRKACIHAFIERETGYVYKPAGLTQPAKGVRYTSVDDALAVADQYGGYLYK